MNLRDLIQNKRNLVKSNMLGSFNIESDNERQLFLLVKAKAYPVGYINKWNEIKMPDGTWKYIGKKGHSHPVVQQLIKEGFSITGGETESKPKEETTPKSKLIHYSKLDTDSAVSAGGSGGAYIMYDKDKKNKFIIKKESSSLPSEKNSREHLISETLTDDLYRVLGIDSSESEIQELESGKIVKVAKFVEGSRTLDSFLTGSATFKIVKEQLKDGFVADCLFLNWDVIGTGLDNIVVDPNSRPHRIDNGGSLLYRAKNGLKPDYVLSAEVSEIELLKSSKNPSGQKIFGDITDKQIKDQVKDIVSKKGELINTIKNSKLFNKEQVADLISKRIDWLDKEYLQKKEVKSVTSQYLKELETLEFHGNPTIKKGIEKQILKVEKENKKYYERHAKNRGISVEEYKSLLQNHVEKLVGESSLFRATDLSILDKILLEDGGRFKSQFEVGTSGGALDPSLRSRTENSYFDFPDNVDIDKTMRPIYGYCSDNINGIVNNSGKHPPDNNVSHYGEVTVRLKDSVKNKATVCFNDSLGFESRIACTPFTKPHFTSLKINSSMDPLDSIESTSVLEGYSSYVEVQYHNQLKAEDIESIHLSVKNIGSFEKINKALEVVRKTNIEVKIYGDE